MFSCHFTSEMASLCKSLAALRTQLCLLVLISGEISASRNTTLQRSDMFCSNFWQHPRYIAAKKNTQVHFICHSRNSNDVQWYKMTGQDKTPRVIDVNGPRVYEERNVSFVMIIFNKIQPEDNGIYLCANKSLARDRGRIRTCGSELRVIGFSTIEQVQRRNSVKDVIIMIQSILLVIFVSVPMLLLLERGDGKASSDEDHTYEGLEIEQTATYEDIAPLRDVKAKWTIGEHPGQE
ncbi:B-cell antigen receptor complex-associated protein beta chain [Trachemys scripta elegans]|uniref:B-cell antigen receptor complex-associated protein beta chain n=1 Tax=Trachemys scripta elegans TaxID=31138 RepID=UPI001555320F|nr:B-cell antigen receptor complex-associated protein beta chain [Trachemys scripta elegans]